jgi:hypothetical protein
MRLAVRTPTEKLSIGAPVALCMAIACNSTSEATSKNGSDAATVSDSSSGGASGGGKGGGAGVGGGGVGGGGLSDAAVEGTAPDAAMVDAGCPSTPCGNCCCPQLAACNAGCSGEIACMGKCVAASGQPYNATVDQQCRANCGNGGVLSPAADSVWTCETGNKCKALCLGG